MAETAAMELPRSPEGKEYAALADAAGQRPG